MAVAPAPGSIASNEETTVEVDPDYIPFHPLDGRDCYPLYWRHITAASLWSTGATSATLRCPMSFFRPPDLRTMVPMQLALLVAEVDIEHCQGPGGQAERVGCSVRSFRGKGGWEIAMFCLVLRHVLISDTREWVHANLQQAN